MSNIQFCIPILDANFTFAIRNTGDDWPQLSVMDGGVAFQQRTFSFGACDEIKINANLTFDKLVNIIYISGMSLDGLNFEVTTGSGNNQLLNAAQSVEPIVRRKHRQVLEWAPTTTGEVELVITGVNQRILDIEQIAFISDVIQPQRNFDGNTSDRIGAIFNNLISQSSSRQKVNTRLRSFRLPFLTLTENELDEIDHAITERMNNGFCLVRLDPENTTGKYNFFASLSLSGGESTQYSGTDEQLTINALEAYER